MEFYTLNNGVELPKVALGTYKSLGNDVRMAVAYALECGYTSIDSASFYGNESDVRAGAEQSGLARNDIFITSKVWNDDHGYDEALRAFDASEQRLGQVDMYLIHWPGKDRFVQTWRALERIYKDGRVQAIGVSNFLPHHLDRLLDCCEIIPAVNQVEAHPYFIDEALLAYCSEKGILMEAWRPLSYALNDPAIAAVAQKHGRSTAQTIIRFLMQRGLRVLPKSITPERIEQNIDVFSFALDEDDMAALNALNTGKRRGNDPDIFTF